MSMNFWFERAGIELRHEIGLDNIMWESDFPHSDVDLPESKDFVERCLEGVPDAERKQLCYGNAVRTYGLN
jgi:predicted TIM-barrel fold metal-dependent hydrolase